MTIVAFSGAEGTDVQTIRITGGGLIGRLRRSKNLWVHVTDAWGGKDTDSA